MVTKIKRYESLEDKIEDYHLRKLKWHHKTKDNSEQDKFLGEYNTLTKAKSDIKKKIVSLLDAALFYPKVIQWACLPNIKEHNSYLQFKIFANDSKLQSFPSMFNKDKAIRKEMEEENKKFVMEVFSEERLSSIIDTIFYNNYIQIDELDEGHRIRIAEMLITKSVYELRRHMDPQMSRLLGNDLTKATEIARNIVYQNRKK